jgi:hypothetical protein
MLRVGLQKYLEPSAPLQYRHFAHAHTHTQAGKLRHDDGSVKISPTPTASDRFQERGLPEASLGARPAA